MILGNNLLNHDQSLSIYAGIAVSFLVEATFAYLAIFRTQLIANKISSHNNETVEVPTTKTDLLEIALAIVSILAVFNSIPILLSQQVNSIYYHDHWESDFWTAGTKNVLFQNLFFLASGIFLLLNARNFAKWITKRGEQDDKNDELIMR